PYASMRCRIVEGPASDGTALATSPTTAKRPAAATKSARLVAIPASETMMSPLRKWRYLRGVTGTGFAAANVNVPPEANHSTTGAGSTPYRLDRPEPTPYLPPLPRRPAVPRIESAKKAMRQGRARHERNRAQSSALRTALKRVRTATTAEQAGGAYKTASRLL